MESAAPLWFVAIGASGGDGLDDIKDLLALLPATLPASVLVVLHRPFELASHLPAILARSAAMPVVTAANGDRFRAGTVYVGEPAEHLTLAAHSLGRLVEDRAALHRNRTVDLLFRSLAEHGGARIIGVVLSGSLDDGSRGLAAINDVGGLSMVVAQSGDAERGMPANAASFDGPIDLIGTTAEIAGAICRAVRGERLPSLD